ncbi:unnamed protein product [Lupinus luteus]|uniref:EF-hand domain-containing protein n=1 Tax=Lupinus luteus TaxID=3873 RepID=A0AAV1WNB3_LUPLU
MAEVLSEEQILEIKEAFGLFDKDVDRCISVEELATCKSHIFLMQGNNCNESDTRDICCGKKVDDVGPK